MPIAKSAKRALRVSEKRRLKNMVAKKVLVQILKNPGQDHGRIQKVIDKATKRGLVHRQKAARLKSRLMKPRPK